LQRYIPEYGYYQQGADVSVNTASLKAQFPYLMRQLRNSSWLDDERTSAGQQSYMNRTEAALAYLKTHDRSLL
jgi:hypothetical protein